jgi:hypothetical protein
LDADLIPPDDAILKSDNQHKKFQSGNRGTLYDVVFTYNNHSDPVWLTAFVELIAQSQGVKTAIRRKGALISNVKESDMPNRYRDWGELRFAMRSLFMFGSAWFRTVILVVSGPTQVPDWLDISHPSIRIVYHEDLFRRARMSFLRISKPNSSPSSSSATSARQSADASAEDLSAYLPTFNSLAIESVLHHIPDLTDHFVYFNNDVFLNRNAEFATTFGGAQSYVRYQDWWVREYYTDPQHQHTSVRCSNWYIHRQHQQQVPSAQEVRQCHFVDFFWDRVLMRQFWDQRLDYWYAHIPHLLQRRILYRIEARLGEHVDRCRRNRMRNALTDVNMNLQYEAFVRMLEHANLEPLLPASLSVNAKRRFQDAALQLMALRRRVKNILMEEKNLQQKHRHSALYAFFTFADDDIAQLPQNFPVIPNTHPQSSETSSSSSSSSSSANSLTVSGDGTASIEWHWVLFTQLRQHSQFVGIEDDLKQSTSASIVAQRCMLHVLMALNWHDRSPWEYSIDAETVDVKSGQPLDRNHVADIRSEKHLLNLLKAQCSKHMLEFAISSLQSSLVNPAIANNNNTN